MQQKLAVAALAAPPAPATVEAGTVRAPRTQVEFRSPRQVFLTPRIVFQYVPEAAHSPNTSSSLLKGSCYYLNTCSAGSTRS
ncbi:hypothetical protein B566_EDAN004727 [Ephemera danica]|nr:hypothetical protein B566_EDAN004727 [Ephemera danica]